MFVPKPLERDKKGYHIPPKPGRVQVPQNMLRKCPRSRATITRKHLTDQEIKAENW